MTTDELLEFPEMVRNGPTETCQKIDVSDVTTWKGDDGFDHLLFRANGRNYSIRYYKVFAIFEDGVRLFTQGYLSGAANLIRRHILGLDKPTC